MDTKGQVVPLKIKVIDDEGASQTIKVLATRSAEKNKLAGNEMIIFKCQVEVSEIIKEIELGYELLSCIWTLRKIS